MVPEYHYDQFQGVAFLQQTDFIVYGIYTPEATQVHYFDRNDSYWKDVLFPLLKDFYWNRYLPCAILKERGIIEEGNIVPTVGITIVPKKSKQ